jgi:hypothetical protein
MARESLGSAKLRKARENDGSSLTRGILELPRNCAIQIFIYVYHFGTPWGVTEQGSLPGSEQSKLRRSGNIIGQVEAGTEVIPCSIHQFFIRSIGGYEIWIERVM